MKKYILLSAVFLVACKPGGEQVIQDAMDSSSSMDSMMESSISSDSSSMDAMMGSEASDAMMKSSDAMMDKGNSSDAMVKQSSAVYTSFNDSVIGNGETSVLFFHAAWCPYCRTHDTNLQAWYNGGADLALSTYKIDYDTAEDLKARYGVVQQDTFVVIDGQGNLVKTVSFPTESALQALLAS